MFLFTIPTVSTSQLNFLQNVHMKPIHVELFYEDKTLVLKEVSHFRCFQWFSYLSVAVQTYLWRISGKPEGYITRSSRTRVMLSQCLSLFYKIETELSHA